MSGLMIAILLYMALIILITTSDRGYVFLPTRMMAIDVAVARDLYLNDLPRWSFWIRSELIANVFNP